MQVLSLGRTFSLIFFVSYGIIIARGEIAMLVLPIVNRNRVMNVQVSLKDAEKLHNSVVLENTKESDVIVNQHNFLDSSYEQDKEDNSVVNFIRNTSLISQNDFLVTTREEAESNRYDVYQVKQPPKFINPALDNLYANVITDMRKEIPNVRRGRYLSFEKIGLGQYLTQEKIARLQQIIKTEQDRNRWPVLFEQAGIADLYQTLEFLNHFNCTVISDTTLPEATLQSTLQALEPLNTQDYRNLKKYYHIAQTNQEIYSRLSLVHHLLYNSPYQLIRTDKKRENTVSAQNTLIDFEQAKQKIKIPNEVEAKDYGKAV